MTRPLTVLAWGAYLATSWTWCIGMILPAMLMRDFGWAGYALFATPNIIGAAAMGWVLKTRRSSEQYQTANRHAVAGFSAITIAFHFAAIPWALSLLGEPSWTPALAGAAIASLAITLAGRPRAHIATSLAWLGSLACIALFVLNAPEPTPLAPIHEPTHLAALTPVVVFGFLLCPYLDPTFHRAAQSLWQKERAAAFTVGFGLLFAVMIGFTALYARPLISVLTGSEATLLPAARTAIALHLGLQAGLTITLHAREGKPVGLCRYRWGAVVLLACCLGLTGYALAAASSTTLFDIHAEEVLYRVFIGAYGLLAPAYVLYRLGGHERSHIIRWALACIIASPAFAYGFIAREELALLPGLGVILAAVPWKGILNARWRNAPISANIPTHDACPRHD